MSQFDDTERLLEIINRSTREQIEQQRKLMEDIADAADRVILQQAAMAEIKAPTADPTI